MAKKYSKAGKRRLFKPSKKSVLLGIVAILIVLGALEATNTTHLFHSDAKDLTVITKAGKSVQTPSENVSASSPTNSEKLPSSGASTASDGRAVDTHGQANPATSPDQWVVSKSGNITVKQPVANAVLKNGGVLSGSAKVDEIHYRLIDSLKGVVAQGTLTVTDGNYSGTMQFTASATSGRLDVFSTQPDGSEINEVQITVGF